MKTTEPGLPPEELAVRLAEVFDLVGPLYRRAQRRVEHDLPTEGLSVGVRAALIMLRDRGPMTVPQLGRAQALSRQFVQRMVNEAVARQLVDVVANPAHKRSWLIRLTDEGRAVIDAVVDRERATLSLVGGGLTDADLTGCVRVLTRLLRFLDNVDMD
jgi:DNA-binding MarR family transcriptional regulator